VSAAGDGREGLRIALVVLVSLALSASHACESGASEAQCLEVDRRYEALTRAAGRQPAGEQQLRVEGCLRDVSRRQASCAISAENLDRLEECFF
jgi:hypothetical protein